MPPSRPPRSRPTSPFPKKEEVSPLPDRNAVKAFHDSMKSLAAAGAPIAETHRHIEEAIQHLEELDCDDALNCAKDALAVMESLHLAYSEVYQNLHEGGYYIYQARTLMMQRKLGVEEEG